MTTMTMINNYDEIMTVIVEMMVTTMIVKLIRMLKCIDGKWLRITMMVAMMMRR